VSDNVEKRFETDIYIYIYIYIYMQSEHSFSHFFLKYGVLLVVTMRMSFFRDMTPFSLVATVRINTSL
jgi:hypothetical protein